MNLFAVRKNWVVAHQVLFVLISIAALIATIAGVFSGWWWLLSYGVFVLMGGIGIVVTFHRYLTHRSFGMSRWKEILFSLFGVLGGTGAPISWVAVHRAHHRHVDTEDDPHGPHKGFFEQVFGASSLGGGINKWSVRDLITDKWYLYLQNYYFAIHIVYAAVLALINPTLVLFCYVIPMTMVVFGSVASNYLTHMPSIGYKRYKMNNDAVNTFVALPFNFGDYLHEEHHKKPWRHNLSNAWWEIDPAGIFIDWIKDPNFVVNKNYRH